MTVTVRGIYATALTRLLREEGVVQASEPIRNRFDAEFPLAVADAAVETTRDRQGVGVSGDPDAVARIADDCALARDALSWDDPTPEGALFAGVVAETLGGGAVVDLGESEGYLPFDSADGYVDEGDAVTVQVRDGAAPWADRRPELDTDVRATTGLVTLARGGTPRGPDGAARLEDLLDAEAPEGWAVRWPPAADDAPMDELADALALAAERAAALDDGLAASDPDEAPGRLAAPLAARWVWFGRESRFALDGTRREVTTTMPGHHRTKAATNAASAAVDFAEAVCEPGATPPADGERAEGVANGEFPFAAVTRQFGPREGDTVAIGHGKPDGRLLVLGRGEVTDYDPDGAVTVRREMTGGGTYDALGVERRRGDVAVTKFHEGRWWYATVYRGEDGERRGTYVNVCTPVEIFPETVRYVDLHVDVVKHADGTVERVDDDELDEAVADDEVPEPLAAKARDVASKLEGAL